MEEILESLELSSDIKEQLSEAFDAAVSKKTEAIVDEKAEEYETYVSKKVEEMKAELSDKLESYLDRVIEEFVEENRIAIEESVNKEKYEAIIEGFNSVLVVAGVDLTRIVEAKKETLAPTIVENTEKIDSLVEELRIQKNKNAELLKLGLIKESMEDMTELQKEKFMTLAAVVEFNTARPEVFVNSLDTIAKSVVSEKRVTESKKEIIVERVENVESTKYTSKVSHLF